MHSVWLCLVSRSTKISATGGSMRSVLLEDSLWLCLVIRSTKISGGGGSARSVRLAEAQKQVAQYEACVVSC